MALHRLFDVAPTPAPVPVPPLPTSVLLRPEDRQNAATIVAFLKVAAPWHTPTTTDAIRAALAKMAAEVAPTTPTEKPQ